MTLLLNSSTINELVADLDPIFDALRAGFAQPPESHRIPGQRVRTDLPANGTATALLPGLLPHVPAYTAKVNAKFPEARPSLRGIVCLHSLHDGELLAVLDSASVTAWRTGLSAAFATDVLARDGATSVGLIGAGVQGQMILHGLAHRRRLDHVVIYDIKRERAHALAELASRQLGLTIEVADGPSDVAGHDIVVLATWSRAPLLQAGDTHPGQHLTSIGADEPGKQELSRDLLSQATLIVDDRELTQRMGAAANAHLPARAIDATFSEVLVGHHPGRTSEDDVTVYTPVGLPWQDLALAWPLYRRAEAIGSGVEHDFLT